MVKSELVKALQLRLPNIMTGDVALAVNIILEQMAKALQSGERIEVRGFGAFSLHQFTARTGRNPKTGEWVNLPNRSAVYFKPGKELRNRVDVAKSKYAINE